MKPSILITTGYDRQSATFIERPNYINAIERVGGVAVTATCDAMLADLLIHGVGDVSALAERYDGLLLSGGGDIEPSLFGQSRDPNTATPDLARDKAEIELCGAFAALGRPVLGICRGMQVINIAFGGTLVQDIPTRYGLPPEMHNAGTARHAMRMVEGSWLHGLLGGEALVNSTHHQAVDTIAEGFAEAAFHGLVLEGMERGNILAVQFHPERMLNEGLASIFRDFIGRFR